jgi:hypothetical protein
MGEKQQKSKAIALTFRPFLTTFSIFFEIGKKQQKSKAIALTFRPFLATFFTFRTGAFETFLLNFNAPCSKNLNLPRSENCMFGIYVQ